MRWSSLRGWTSAKKILCLKDKVNLEASSVWLHRYTVTARVFFIILNLRLYELWWKCSTNRSINVKILPDSVFFSHLFKVLCLGMSTQRPWCLWFFSLSPGVASFNLKVSADSKHLWVRGPRSEPVSPEFYSTTSGIRGRTFRGTHMNQTVVHAIKTWRTLRRFLATVTQLQSPGPLSRDTRTTGQNWASSERSETTQRCTWPETGDAFKSAEVPDLCD